MSDYYCKECGRLIESNYQIVRCNKCLQIFHLNRYGINQFCFNEHYMKVHVSIECESVEYVKEIDEWLTKAEMNSLWLDKTIKEYGERIKKLEGRMNE